MKLLPVTRTERGTGRSVPSYLGMQRYRIFWKLQNKYACIINI